MTQKKLAIYGAGGFGKEVRGMLDFQPEQYTFAGYFDDYKEGVEKVQNENYDDVLFCMADPSIRSVKVNSWKNKIVPFTSFASPDVVLHKSVVIERGSIICAGAKLTVDISIGQFVIINLNSTIGHDVSIGDFTSLMPSVNLSGNVTIGKRVFIGSGATILQGLTIGDDVVIGAGAVVTKSIEAGQRVKGVPAQTW